MFAENLTPEVLRRVLLPRDQFHPFPDMRDRAYWTALPDAVRQGLVSAGEAAMASPWPALPATLYLDFSRTGARTPYELTYFARRAALCSMVLAECVEGAGRFLDAIVNALWSICEESTWVIPAHCGLQKADSRLPDTSEPVVDLFAGETGALVSWTRYLLGSALDAISPLIAPRLASEVQRRVILPCLSRDDFWWMAGASGRASNWTVWTCSNWLTCVLLDEPDPERRVQAAAKIAGCLNRYADAVPQDGGCDEGPHYWSYAAASLVDALDLLAAATQGKLSFYDQPIVRDMVRYIAYAHICDRYFVNFADGPGVLQVDPFLLHRCGRRVQDKDVMSLAASLAAPGQAPSGGLFGTLGRVLWSLQEQPLIAAH
ncbi:MAG TPA: heparinase, partial [Candidatus Brocadiia bacterium]|nr:heparinase [Candidatus Brocadiia bacterium]